MSTIPLTDPRLAPARDPRPAGALRRVASIGASEVRLFYRNKTVLLTAVLLGPAFAMVFLMNLDLTQTPNPTVVVTNLVFSFAAMMAMFYNLTAIYVTRREDRVFKRLLTGEARPMEVAAAAATPSALIFVSQVVLAGVVAVVVFGSPSWDSPVLVVVAFGLTIVCLTGMSGWASSFTSNTEAAQYSTLPVLLVLLVLSGTSFPLSGMPDIFMTVAQTSPMYAASELISLGMSGVDLTGQQYSGFVPTLQAASRPLLVLGCWTVLGVWLASRTMRFDPRR